MLHLFFISPVDDDDDVDLQSCIFQPLLCTMSHLLASSRIKQVYWSFNPLTIPQLTMLDAVVGLKWKVCYCMFGFRIQALQRSSALRWVLRMAKCSAVCKRSSSTLLWCSAPIHLLQHIVTRRRLWARWATAKKKKNRKRNFKRKFSNQYYNVSGIVWVIL